MYKKYGIYKVINANRLNTCYFPLQNGTYIFIINKWSTDSFLCLILNNTEYSSRFTYNNLFSLNINKIVDKNGLLKVNNSEVIKAEGNCELFLWTKVQNRLYKTQIDFFT